MPLSGHSVGTFLETSSHATCQGTFGHSHLSSLSHCGLVLSCKVELVCMSFFVCLLIIYNTFQHTVTLSSPWNYHFQMEPNCFYFWQLEIQGQHNLYNSVRNNIYVLVVVSDRTVNLCTGPHYSILLLSISQVHKCNLIFFSGKNITGSASFWSKCCTDHHATFMQCVCVCLWYISLNSAILKQRGMNYDKFSMAVKVNEKSAGRNKRRGGKKKLNREHYTNFVHISLCECCLHKDERAQTMQQILL